MQNTENAIQKERFWIQHAALGSLGFILAAVDKRQTKKAGFSWDKFSA